VKKFLLVVALAVTVMAPASAYTIRYAEQWYKLFHEHFYQYPDDTMENIWYLQQALKSDFANPLYALAKINNKVQWERYRYLFSMHVNLLLIQQYRLLASKYDKQVAYFYNYPWRNQNLDSLKTAEKLYKTALAFWPVAVKWSQKAAAMPLVQLNGIQYWEDESYRIQTGRLNYLKIIQMNLNHLQYVRKVFRNMNSSTY
jgi:hypothetical protein